MENDDLAWMLFVDGCEVLQIIRKTNIFKPDGLKLKVNLVSITRDLFLVENQIPYRVLQLLCKDETKLKISMYIFCDLQNIFKASESPDSLCFEEIDKHKIEILRNSSTPTHLLDCLRKFILSSGMDSLGKDVRQHEKNLSNERRLNVRQLEEILSDDVRRGEQIKAENLLEVVRRYANKKERYITCLNIQKLKTSAIRVEKQKNISLEKISFSSSLFSGKLHLPPLVLNDSTISTLLNLLAYEMCPLFKNEFEICSYVKFLDLLIDYPDDVKELRSSGILHNLLGSDDEVVELLNTISSELVHNPTLCSRLKHEVEKHYKKRLGMWIAVTYYRYFSTPWSAIAQIALVLTALQTWLAFKSC